MTLASPTLLISISKSIIQTATKCDCKVDEIQASLLWETQAWMLIFLVSFIRFFWHICACLIHDILLAPTYFWKLCWQENGRSIFAMLRDPSGTHHSEFRGTQCQHIHPRQWRRGCRRTKRVHLEQGSDQIVGYDWSLYMHSYYQMDRQNINRCEHGGTRKDHEESSDKAYKETMAFIHYYASTFFSAIKIINTKRPKKPPEGYTSELEVIVTMLGIFSYITCSAAISLALLPKKKRHRRKRSDDAHQ